MKKTESYYVTDAESPEMKCKYRIQKLPFCRTMNRSAVYLPLTDTLFVVEKKVIGNIWIKRRQFATINEAHKYVTRKALPVAV